MDRKNAPIIVGQSAHVSGPSVAEKNHADAYVESIIIHGGNVNFFFGKNAPHITKKDKTSKKSGIIRKVARVITYPLRRIRKSQYKRTEAVVEISPNDSGNVEREVPTLDLNNDRPCPSENSDSDITDQKQIYGTQIEIECIDYGVCDLDDTIAESGCDEVFSSNHHDDDTSDYISTESESTSVKYNMPDVNELRMRMPAFEKQCRGERYRISSVSDSDDPSTADSYETDDSLNTNALLCPFERKNQRKRRVRTFTKTYFKSPYERCSIVKNEQITRELNINQKRKMNGEMINRSSYTDSLDSGVVCFSNDEDSDINKNNRHKPRDCNTNCQTRLICSLKRMNGHMKRRRSMSLKKKLKRTVKNVVRDFYFNENQQSNAIFGLGSYFDRLNNCSPPSLQEQMRYEWIRLASFQHYTGTGNALNLARNGFYHRHTDGPSSTRCAYCDVRYSSWEYFDNIETIHRQMSPDCTVGRNNACEYADTQIRRDGAPEVINIHANIPNGNSSFSSSVREVCRVIGNQVIATANPRSVFGEVDTRDHPEYLQARAVPCQPDTTAVTPHTSVDQNNSPVETPDRNTNPLVVCSAANTQQVELEENVTAQQVDADENIAAEQVYIEEHETALQADIEEQDTEKKCVYTSENNNNDRGARRKNSGQRRPRIVSNNTTRPPDGDNVVDNAQYNTMAQRVNSFQGFPGYMDPTPERMIRARFFNGEDPFVEHARRFPSCGCVVDNTVRDRNGTLAQSRQEQITISETRSIGPHNERYPLAILHRSSNCNIGRTIQTLEINNPPYPGSVELAIQYPITLSWADNMGSITLGNERQPGLHNSDRNNTADHTDSATTKEDKHLRNVTRCKVCREQPIGTLFLPCGHSVACTRCAEGLSKCPLCKKRIKRDRKRLTH